MHKRTRAVALALVASLAVPATALAVDYPPPSQPAGPKGKPKGPFKTLRVGKTQKYKKIQAAVNAAKAGDTIIVDDGTYKEGVVIKGQGKRYLKLVGNTETPHKVVLDGKGLKGNAVQNGIIINGADNVSVRGMKARNYKGNGFFAVNTQGYLFDKLIAERVGVYGIYAFNSKGGAMINSLAYLNSDGGFYVGQTPKQTKPLRTIIRNVSAWGNVSGYTGTNSRYVTITKSKFFNNAIGIVPNTLDSEKFPPNEENTVIDNDVFWNNFDVYGPTAPYKANRGRDFIYPPGVGIIALGGMNQVFEGNRIYGNWLGGFVASPNPFLDAKKVDPALGNINNNRVIKNAFSLGGADPNGRDIVFVGGGKDNCFADNTGVTTTVGVIATCPFTGDQPISNDGLGLMLGAAIPPDSKDPNSLPDYKGQWKQGPHKAQSGLEPLVQYKAGGKFGPTTLR